MDYISKTKGIIDKISGTTRKTLQKRRNIPFDLLQKFMTVGEYRVGPAEATPKAQNFDLIVYKDNDGILHQALRPIDSDDLAPTYVRKFDKRLDRFRAFHNVKTKRRYIVEQQLDEFTDYINHHVRKGENSVNIGILTDTHYKDSDSIDFYGYNGLTHVREFNYLEDKNILDLKAHLGDWIDGSDTGLVGERQLKTLQRVYKSDKVNYAIIKGNHDENDKFDEHHDLKASFPKNEFEDIMWPEMYRQKGINYISRKHGVAYFDKDDLRIITVNTSDVPYVLDDQGKKKYDIKLVLGLREDQIQEIIEILEDSSNKKIVLMSHANPINRKGLNALKYNGRSLHELLVAFNQQEKGFLNSHDVPEEFRLANSFDFTKVKNASVIAYLCGHRHTEYQYRINGIQYILFNCSALMGPNHAMTPQFNKRINRKIDHANESAGYVVNFDLNKKIIQVFGYGATFRKRRLYRI